MSLLEHLAARKLLVVTGKGGVGKSALAAALGSLLAERGGRVLVLEIDPRETIHAMLGVSPSGGEVLRAAPRLYLQNLQFRRVIDELVRERVPIATVARRILASPVYQHFTAGAPGLKELAVLGHALLLTQGKVPGAPRVDLVVLDAPATGHGVSLMAAPGLVHEVIRHGPIGAMTAQAAELVADPAASATVVVTLAEEMPVTEALELRERLETEVGREPELLIANGLYPPLPPGRGGSGGAPELSLWRDRRRLNERELARLARSWKGPRIELPLLPVERGPELATALRGRLSRQLAELDGEGAG